MTFYDHHRNLTYTDVELLPSSQYTGGFVITYAGGSGISISYFLECYAEANPQLVTYIQTHYPEACL